MNSIHTNLSSYGRYDISLAVKLKNIAGDFSNAYILDVSSLFSINHKKNAQFGAYWFYWPIGWPCISIHRHLLYGPSSIWHHFYVFLSVLIASLLGMILCYNLGWSPHDYLYNCHFILKDIIWASSAKTKLVVKVRARPWWAMKISRRKRRQRNVSAKNPRGRGGVQLPMKKGRFMDTSRVT